ncbi:MAG: spore germination protein [Paenibacillaceae bacterium]|jgi:spore germination protein KB|nr:spore germination protein [Paenibacillaceae bacterium]
MNKEAISKTQALMLGISGITVSGHLLFIPVILNLAGRDAWISLALALFPALYIGYVTASLACRFPGKTIVEYVQTICGKWLGRAFGWLIIVYFFHDLTLNVRGFGEFYNAAITPRTPILVYLIGIHILAVYAIRSGVEVLARTNQFFLVILISMGIMASLLTMRNKDYLNLLPIMEYGIKPALGGMVSLMSLFTTIFVLGMVFPFVQSTRNLKRNSLITMGVLVLMFIGPLTGAIATFGLERSIGLNFPTFLMLRDIKVGQLQRLDLVAVLLWSLGSFGKVVLFLHAITLGIAKLCGMSDYRMLVVPVAVLVIVTSLYNSDSFIELYRFLRDFYPYYSILIGLIVPSLLLAVALLRKMHPNPEGG